MVATPLPGASRVLRRGRIEDTSTGDLPSGRRGPESASCLPAWGPGSRDVSDHAPHCRALGSELTSRFELQTTHTEEGNMGWRRHTTDWKLQRDAVRLVLLVMGISSCCASATGLQNGGRQMGKPAGPGATSNGRRPPSIGDGFARMLLQKGWYGTDATAFVPLVRFPPVESSLTPRPLCRRRAATVLPGRPVALPLRMRAENVTPEPSENESSVRQSAEVESVGTVSMGSRPRSELWGQWTEHEVKVATLLWIEKFVIGMKLCPFAMEAMNGLRIHVAGARNRETALDKVDVELKWIVGLDKGSPACTLMVYPPALFEKRDKEKNSPLCTLDGDTERKGKEDTNCDVDECEGFDGFMSLASDAREMAQVFNAAHGQDIDTETLLLTFHPNSTFSDVADDPADYALRSPFPTILILRGTDVREAEDLCDIQGRVTEDIAIANEARLRSLGYDKLRDVFVSIVDESRSRRGEAERELLALQAQRQAQMATEAVAEDYESDGFDGLESVMDFQDSKDPVGWFPPPGELRSDVGRAGAEGKEGEEEDETKQGKNIMREPFDPLGYEPGAGP